MTLPKAGDEQVRRTLRALRQAIESRRPLRAGYGTEAYEVTESIEDAIMLAVHPPDRGRAIDTLSRFAGLWFSQAELDRLWRTGSIEEQA